MLPRPRSCNASPTNNLPLLNNPRFLRLFRIFVAKFRRYDEMVVVTEPRRGVDMSELGNNGIVTLDITEPVWERFFSVAPLVLIGTRDPDGSADLAPKHMVTPVGWDNYFGFVCTPSHNTYKNIRRSGEFTVSYPRPSQVLFASLAASPRCEDDSKPIIQAMTTMTAKKVDGVFIEDAYLFFECEHHRTINDFGVNSFITGKIIAAYANEDALRESDRDDQSLIHNAPLFAYLHPGRFAEIDESLAFPFPANMKR